MSVDQTSSGSGIARIQPSGEESVLKASHSSVYSSVSFIPRSSSVSFIVSLLPSPSITYTQCHQRPPPTLAHSNRIQSQFATPLSRYVPPFKVCYSSCLSDLCRRRPPPPQCRPCQRHNVHCSGQSLNGGCKACRESGIPLIRCIFQNMKVHCEPQDLLEHVVVIESGPPRYIDPRFISSQYPQYAGPQPQYPQYASPQSLYPNLPSAGPHSAGPNDAGPHGGPHGAGPHPVNRPLLAIRNQPIVLQATAPRTPGPSAGRNDVSMGGL